MKPAESKENRDKTLSKGIFGIHHVTAITSDAQRNIDFYTNNLGLRCVKLTVNQDDPTSYHLSSKIHPSFSSRKSNNCSYTMQNVSSLLETL